VDCNKSKKKLPKKTDGGQGGSQKGRGSIGENVGEKGKTTVLSELIRHINKNLWDD